jgi:manganese efflux pump family protein
MLKLLAFTLPLCLDTFAVAFAVLGEMQLTRVQRTRVTLLLIAFEAGMPLIGMALGTPLAHLAGTAPHLAFDPYQLGSPAEAYQLQLANRTHLADTVDVTFVGRYIIPVIVPVVVGGLGILMLDECFNEDDDDDDEAGKARAMVGARGLSVIGLGLGISLDELVVGFTLSFNKFPVADVLTASFSAGKHARETSGSTRSASPPAPSWQPGACSSRCRPPSCSGPRSPPTSCPTSSTTRSPT